MAWWPSPMLKEQLSSRTSRCLPPWCMIRFSSSSCICTWLELAEGAEFRTLSNPPSNPGLLTLLNLNPMWGMRQGWRNLSSPEKAWIVSRGFSCAGEYGVMHYISLPSTHSPPLSWSLKDIAYKRDDSRRRPSSVVLLHLGATAACLWRDKVVPFSFCILRPIF